MLEVKKFSATWCGPCKSLVPLMNEIKMQFPTGVRFIDYDVDTEKLAAAQYGVNSVPTVIFVKDGVELKRITGLNSKSAYINAINESK
jgi:thioredoxin 1